LSSKSDLESRCHGQMVEDQYGYTGSKLHLEIGKTFKPSNNSAIVSSFHVDKREKNKFLIYKAPNNKV